MNINTPGTSVASLSLAWGNKLLIIVLLIFFAGNVQGQTINGRVVDSLTGEGLPFATVRFQNGQQGVVTDIHGNFSLKRNNDDKTETIEVRYVSYEPKRLKIDAAEGTVIIPLRPQNSSLEEFVFTPPYDKIRRIIEQVIANRDRHNPDKMDQYRCHVYYKWIVDVADPDSAGKSILSDLTDSVFSAKQYLFVSETYSIRTWKKPQKLQEDVLATRFSGFKKSPFNSLITDVLPFHSYGNFIQVNGKDYYSPVAPGFGTRYTYNLVDELVEGRDTIWMLSFRPRHTDASCLAGRVYIHSDGYAISSLVAEASDPYLKRTIKLEQQYRKTGDIWFPRELNYVIHVPQKTVSGDGEHRDTIQYSIILRGTSVIDSVSNTLEPNFKFDRAHTVRLRHDVYGKTPDEWGRIRPAALSDKEQETYKVTDSVMASVKADKYLPYLDKLIDGRFPVGFFDVDLKRLYASNKFEKSRFGLGLQTNEKLIPNLSLGGWFGYGTGDKRWKYGGFLEYYGDAYKDFIVRLSYDNTLRDPGRLQLNKELDKSYLRMFLLNRADSVATFQLSLTKRLGYWTVTLSGGREYIRPLYGYRFSPDGVREWSSFTSTEASLNVRFAFGERRTPVFGKYLSTGTIHPVFYAKVTMGRIESAGPEIPFVQAVAALQWQKHLNRIGNERFLVIAGKSWSDDPLPLSKLFAGKGFRLDESFSFYSFGGMLTMYPYDYYSDQFVNLYWRHDFDRSLFTTSYSAPSVSLAYNMLVGTLANPEAHQNVSFRTPETAYHETGIILNNLLRINYFNLYYIGLAGGYFYHWPSGPGEESSGICTLGLNVSF